MKYTHFRNFSLDTRERGDKPRPVILTPNISKLPGKAMRSLLILFLDGSGLVYIIYTSGRS